MCQSGLFREFVQKSCSDSCQYFTSHIFKQAFYSAQCMICMHLRGRTFGMTLPSLSRKQMLKQLMQTILIQIPNSQTSKREKERTIAQHSKSNTLGSSESGGKRRLRSPNPPRRLYVLMNPI
jgi:hypothetical protein